MNLRYKIGTLASEWVLPPKLYRMMETVYVRMCQAQLYLPHYKPLHDLLGRNKEFVASQWGNLVTNE